MHGPGRDDSLPHQGGGSVEGYVEVVSRPGRSRGGNRLLSLVKDEAVQHAKGASRHPVIVSIMDERNQLRSIMGHAARGRVLTCGLGGRRGSEMWAMRFPRCGAGCHHDVTSNALSIWAKGDKVSTLGLIWADVYQLFRVGVPACLAT